MQINHTPQAQAIIMGTVQINHTSQAQAIQGQCKETKHHRHRSYANPSYITHRGRHYRHSILNMVNTNSPNKYSAK